MTEPSPTAVGSFGTCPLAVNGERKRRAVAVGETAILLTLPCLPPIKTPNKGKCTGWCHQNDRTLVNG